MQGGRFRCGLEIIKVSLLGIILVLKLKKLKWLNTRKSVSEFNDMRHGWTSRGNLADPAIDRDSTIVNICNTSNFLRN